MCHRMLCRHCGKPTWAGCGAHVEQALAGVPKQARCRCREEAPKTGFRTQETSLKPKSRKVFGFF